MNPPKNRENSITRYYITEENLVGSVKERKADYDEMERFMLGYLKENIELFDEGWIYEHY